MAYTNTQKANLNKTLWAIANDVRGKGVTGWDFKSYVLDTIFYMYLSQKLEDYINTPIQENEDKNFQYSKLTDEYIDSIDDFKEQVIRECGFFLYPSELFCNVAAWVDNSPQDAEAHLNKRLENIFKNIEESGKDIAKNHDKVFKDIFEGLDFNSAALLGNTTKKKNEKLMSLISNINKAFKDVNFKNTEIDIFGDVYEYLTGMYASDAGKKGGEFFTPQEVSELLAMINNYETPEINSVYDPACGSGSLLLKMARNSKNPDDVEYYGQEINTTTYNLCRMNLILHDVKPEKIHIACDDTLESPAWDNKVDAVSSNPPYSIDWKGIDNPLFINDPRFAGPAVLAPKSKADYAFILDGISHLKNNGTAPYICFPGIFYRTGAEQKIRKYLIDKNLVNCIIQLPENLFYGTSIATCIMVIKKNKTDNNVLFIDASDFVSKGTNQNYLSDENLDDIMTLYKNRTDEQYHSRLVSYDEIEKQKFNLSISTYVEKKDNRERISDIKAFNNELKAIVKKEEELRKAIDELIAEIEG